MYKKKCIYLFGLNIIKLLHKNNLFHLNWEHHLREGQGYTVTIITFKIIPIGLLK